MKHRIPVTRRALVQRINRRLSSDGKRLLKKRGEYFLIEGSAATRVDLEQLGRKLRLLMAYEALQ